MELAQALCNIGFVPTADTEDEPPYAYTQKFEDGTSIWISTADDCLLPKSYDDRIVVTVLDCDLEVIDTVEFDCVDLASICRLVLGLKPSIC